MDVVQAIRTHPDAEVAKCLKIGAVTCCVDPLNTFMENRWVLTIGNVPCLFNPRKTTDAVSDIC